jgi:putative spermidine/putrescine transport system permease protein
MPVVALHYAALAAGVYVPQSVDAMAMISMIVTLVWPLSALRFVNPMQLVSRVKEHLLHA